VNQFFVIRGGAVGTKHVFAGSTRMVTKLAKQENPTIKSNNAGGGGKDKGPRERDMYFYHPDHLGSSSYVTDEGGRVFQHLEYFPFGETWVAEDSNTQRTPYLFTGKELDEDTGLYYFGARYYDQRTSVWASVDPILGQYLPTGNSKHDQNLPGGGVFSTTNLNLYHYSGQNPIVYVDPNGLVKLSVEAWAKATAGKWEITNSNASFSYDFRDKKWTASVSQTMAGLQTQFTTDDGVIFGSQPIGFDVDAGAFKLNISGSITPEYSSRTGGGASATFRVQGTFDRIYQVAGTVSGKYREGMSMEEFLSGASFSIGVGVGVNEKMGNMKTEAGIMFSIQADGRDLREVGQIITERMN